MSTPVNLVTPAPPALTNAQKLAVAEANAAAAEAAVAEAATKAKAAKEAKEALAQKKKEANAAAAAAAEKAAAEAAVAAKAQRKKEAEAAELAATKAVQNSLLQANNSKRGFITTPITIQFVDAAKKGNVKLLERLHAELLGTSFTPGTPKYNNTLNNALFAAASGGYKGCVNFLIEKGASIKIRDAERNTILHAAVKSLKTPEQIPDIRGIIEDVNEKDKTLFKEINKQGETILHLAAKSPVKGSERIVNKILELDGVDKTFVNAKTKNTLNAIENGKSNAKTALELVHNLNVTKVNNRGRAGRYPMYNVHFKKVKALLDKDALKTITTNIPENAEVYPLLMKYYNKLNSMSGETANIKGIQNAAAEAAKEGKGVYGFEGANYYTKQAAYLREKAGLSSTNATKKATLIRRAEDKERYAQLIRNKRAKEAANRTAKSITGVRRGLMGYTNNTYRARAVAAAAAAKNAATRAAAAKNAATRAAAAAAPQKSFFQRMLGRGGTRKNRSRKNKSTRKNRKH